MTCEAQRIGLVSRAVPEEELLDACFEVGERIASFSRPGPRLVEGIEALAHILHPRQVPLAEGLDLFLVAQT